MVEASGVALVLLGGFFGGLARFWLSGLIARLIGEVFPWGTLVVNVSGAFAIGALVGASLQEDGLVDTDAFRNLVIVGFLGGYTTVSSFSLQTLALALEGDPARSMLNIALSAVCGVAAVGLGILVMLQVLR